LNGEYGKTAVAPCECALLCGSFVSQFVPVQGLVVHILDRKQVAKQDINARSFQVLQTMADYTAIPQPPSIPFLGNVTDLESEVPLRSFSLLSKTYGEIYQLNLLGRSIVVISTQELNNQVSNEKMFHKDINPNLLQIRELVKDGLFTAFHDEPNWAVARMSSLPSF
jgi:hypothetical protein